MIGSKQEGIECTIIFHVIRKSPTPSENRLTAIPSWKCPSLSRDLNSACPDRIPSFYHLCHRHCRHSWLIEPLTAPSLLSNLTLASRLPCLCATVVVRPPALNPDVLLRFQIPATPVEVLRLFQGFVRTGMWTQDHFNCVFIAVMWSIGYYKVD